MSDLATASLGESPQAPVATEEVQPEPQAGVAAGEGIGSQFSRNLVSQLKPSEVSNSAETGLSKKELIQKAKEEMRKNACTEWNDKTQTHAWRPLWRTSRADLDAYGVGTRLYFDFLFQMGICFFVLSLLAAPSLVLFYLGDMLNETNPVYQFLGKLSIANLGSCPGGACRSEAMVRDRLAYKDSEEPLTDFTQWMGLLDGIAVIFFLLFGMYFRFFWVPRVVKQTDAKNATPSDFAVYVSQLPKRLREHHDLYKTRLQEHVLSVLKENGITDEAAVQEVTLVRNYDGAIRKFEREGQVLTEIAEQEAKLEIAKSAGKTRQLARVEKKLQKLQKENESISKSLKEQGHMKDEERDVCNAYVMFNKEEYKDQILHSYRFSRNRFFRPCMSRKLRFDSHCIRVRNACEPSDLYWENLDFGKWKRFCRGMTSVIVALLVLVVCIFCLVSSQSIKHVSALEQPTRAWVLKSSPESASTCFHVCEWQLFQNMNCFADQDNSRNWNVTRIFDPRGSSNMSSSLVASSASMQASIFDCNHTCVGAWSSPSCSNQSSSSSDWIGIEFDKDRTLNHNVRCMSLWQPFAAARKQFQLYACSAAVLPTPGSDHSKWKPEKACMLMEDVMPNLPSNALAADASVDSGSLPIKRDSSCSTPVDFEVAEDLVKSGADKVEDPTLSCYCKQQEKIQGYGFRLPSYNTPSKSLCQDWSMRQNQFLGMLVGGVFAVLILNQILYYAFTYLVEWIRCRTATAKTRNRMVLLFAALFVNTGILVLLVNWSFLRELPLDFSSIFKGRYHDFDRTFFPSVGSSLCLTIAMITVSDAAPQYLWSFILNPLIACYYQRGVVTQQKLNKIYQLPDWSVSNRLAQVMNAITCVMMYSGGMPALYIVGVIYCFVAYWTDKVVLLRGSCKPPTFNESILVTALTLFPLVAFMHTIVSVWMFGQQNLFPSTWSNLTWLAEGLVGMTREESAKIVNTYQPGAGDYAEYLKARSVDLSRDGCVLLFLIFLAFVALFVLSFLWRRILRLFLFPLEVMLKECIRACRGKPKSGRDSTEDAALMDIRDEMKKRGVVHSYNIADNPRYQHACKALDFAGTKSESMGLV